MKNILIVIDMQNGFNRYEQTHSLAKKVVELTNSNYFDYIIATRFLNREGSQYIKFLNWHRLMKSPEIDLVDGLKADKVIDKWIYTCVDSDFLDILKNINNGNLPTHVFLCGADTDCCVLKIATDLFEQAIMPIVLTEYCDSNGGPASHNAGVLAMERLIGTRCLISGRITRKQDIIDLIENRKY